jgi:hypothetical protein
VLELLSKSFNVLCRNPTNANTALHSLCQATATSTNTGMFVHHSGAGAILAFTPATSPTPSHLTIIETLVADTPKILELTNAAGATPLLAAIESNQRFEIIAKLMELQANVCATLPDGKSAMQVAHSR